jgi:hypothetical protein
MIEVLKQMQEALREYHYYTIDAGLPNQSMLNKGYAAYQAGKQAIAELESQEPVAWLLTEKNINSLQVDSIELLINRLKHAHHTNLSVRINGQDEWFQADWLKHMVRVTPPQRTEPKVCCQQYDTCLEPCTPRGRHLAQRTWVGLASEDRLTAKYMQDAFDGIEAVIDYIEAKLKEKNT